MARLLVYSDLHMEFDAFVPPDPAGLGPIDGVLLAGDTDSGGRHIIRAAEIALHFDAPVRMVRGNHEPYGTVWEEFLATEREDLARFRDAGADIAVLDGTSDIIAGTEIVGATLWTDFAATPEGQAHAMIVASHAMADYRAIRIGAARRPLTPADVLALHARDKARLWTLLARPRRGPRIVMTHHMPVVEAVHPKWAGAGAMNAAFANNMMGDIIEMDFDAWICGHSHEIRQTDIPGPRGPRPLIANPRGYPHETTIFDPTFILDTTAFPPRENTPP